jgi:hypothetical protein
MPDRRGATLDELPVNLRLGARAEAVRRGWPAIRTVVVVPDEASYLEALAHWTLKGRFPVLLDDGTEGAREDIARFVRAFEPAAVVRWSSGRSNPADAKARRAAIESSLFRAWTTPLTGEDKPPQITSQDQVVERWKVGGVLPPGIILADAGDPAWTAALAAAIGRGEPIAWVSVPGPVNGAMSIPEFTAMADAAETAAERTGLAWREIGDDLDAITLCLNCPVKVQLDPTAVVATTDLLGRVAGETAGAHTPRETGHRWAWSGQIFGSSSQAAYREMCALFLAPTRAWVFDGYADTKPWSDYDGSAAAKTLEQAHFKTVVDDLPRNGERAWQVRANPGVDAGLIMVNTKGNADEFQLEPGRCRPGDIPFLNVPAIVYFVHSWSAAMPAERTTVAGRWLERGAYAYLGSTQEPYLVKFVPTPAVAARLVLGFPWAAAVRFDDTRPPGHPEAKPDVPAAWKIATFGDPLITLGPAPAVSTLSLPLEGAKNYTDLLSEALAAKDFAKAISCLTILGRDQDASKLAAAIAKDDPKAFTPMVAAAAVLPAYRAHDSATLVKAYANLPAGPDADPVRRDALWHGCAGELSGPNGERIVGLLRANLRPDQIGSDAADLARTVARFYGRETAISMLSDAKGRSRTDYDRAKAEDAIKMLSARPGSP